MLRFGELGATIVLLVIIFAIAKLVAQGNWGSPWVVKVITISIKLKILVRKAKILNSQRSVKVLAISLAKASSTALDVEITFCVVIFHM